MSKIFGLSGWLSGGLHTAGSATDPGNNLPPVADFTFAAAALVVTLTDNSSDPDGTIATRLWSYGDGTPTSTTQNPSHTYALPGTYNVTLTVTDNDGASDSFSRSITVASTGSPPVANFTIGTPTGLAQPFTDTSTDADGTIASRLWDFGDGAISTVTNPTRVYLAAGSYDVRLTVTDNSGNTNSRTRRVTLSPAATTGLRTRIDCDNLRTSLFGTAVTPDANIQSTSANSWLADNTGYIDLARNAGTGGRAKTPRCCLVIKFTPGNRTLKDANNDFSIVAWRAAFDRVYNGAVAMTPAGYSNGIAKLRAAVRDGVVRVLYLLDDFAGADNGTEGSNAFAHAVTFFQLEQMAYHVKVTRNMPWMPCTARARASYFHSTQISARVANVVGPGGHSASQGYKYMDCAWMQMRLDRDGDVASYITHEWINATACGLGGMGGGNLLNGGRSTTVNGVLVHNDPIWRQRRSGETDAQYQLRMHPSRPSLWGMSPAEIRELGFAMLSDVRVCGFGLWRADDASGVTDAFGYWNDSEIQSALLAVYNRSVGRTEGPVNIRGDLAAA